MDENKNEVSDLAIEESNKKMEKELEDMVKYIKKSCGNVQLLVSNKMKRIGVKMSYDIKEDVFGEEFKNFCEKHRTVKYVDGDVIYYIPLEIFE